MANGWDEASAWRVASDLCAAREEREVAAVVVRTAGTLSTASAARVWMFDHSEGWRLSGAWPDPGTAKDRAPAEVAKAVAAGGPRATSARAPFRSRLVIPILAGSRPVGAVELLESARDAGPYTVGDAAQLEPLLLAAGGAIGSARASTAKERDHLDTIVRLTRLYDISRSLGARMEMDDLLVLVADRTQNALGAEGAYFWLASADGKHLSIAAAAGPSADAVSEWTLEVGEGAAGQTAAAGQALLFDDPEELPGLDERADVQAGLEVSSVAAAPVASADGELFGVVEAVNQLDGDLLDANQLPMLAEIAEVAGVAIANARNLMAERRASDLHSLLETTRELGASLDPQKVTFTLVHKAAAVIGYQTAAVGLLKGSRLELAAVSGQTLVDPTLPKNRALIEVLAWAAELNEGFYVVQGDDGSIDTERAETREKFRAYFQATAVRSFLAIPMSDDEGRLGVFALEAAEPYAFSERDIEAATLLGVQATVAIRNATLYKQIPMLHVMKPLAQRGERIARAPWARKVAYAGGALLFVAAMLIPAPLRVGGDVRVLPIRRLSSTAEVDGRVTRVLVREGDRVEAGQVVAEMDDTDYRGGLEAARSRYESAMREQSLKRAAGEVGGAAVEAARLQGLRAEMALWETRVARTVIRAATSGVVATPRVDEKVGSRLSRGEIFCEVVDPASQSVEVAVPEQDAGLVRAGMAVKIKLNAFPTSSFRGTIDRVGVAATPVDNDRVVLSRVRIGPESPPLATGMTGRAKVSVGSTPLARVVLRRPARWIWTWLWGWLP